MKEFRKFYFFNRILLLLSAPLVFAFTIVETILLFVILFIIYALTWIIKGNHECIECILFKCEKFRNFVKYWFLVGGSDDNFLNDYLSLFNRSEQE